MIDIDIRFHPRFIAANRSFGECFAAEIGALEYVECSGVTGEGIEFAFERATEFGLQRGSVNEFCAFPQKLEYALY